MKTLVVTPSRCIGCRTCELACSFRHAPPGGTIGKARINVRPAGPNRYMPLTCLQCAEAACVQACPVFALQRNEATGAVDVDRDKCIGCRLCTIVCPFGHITMDEVAAPDKCVKCDLCVGSPACAAFCPSKALEYV